MRSVTLTPRQSSDMSVSVWISLILICFPAAGTETFIPCLSWNPVIRSQVIWTQVEETASISCDIISKCPQIAQTTWWFVFNESGYHKLDLLKKSKYILQSTDLMINLTSPEDSGLYVCAIWRDVIGPEQQLIGRGTTLVVRGNALVWHILLWMLFALLTIYNLSIMIIIYRKKTGAHLKPRVGMPKESNSTSRLHFRCVVEELYNRRNLRHNEADKDGREGQPCKAEGARSKPSNEDLYQNL